MRLHESSRRKRRPESEDMARKLKARDVVARDLVARDATATDGTVRDMKESDLELIIGNKRVIPDTQRNFPGGIEVTLAGEALSAVLDATFHGFGSIEAHGGVLHRRRLDVTDIRMHGASTTVTLLCTGNTAQQLH